MKASVFVVLALVAVVSCAPPKDLDSDSEVIEAAPSSFPQPAAFIPNQYKVAPNQPAVYPFSQPQHVPAFQANRKVPMAPGVPKYYTPERREPQYAILRSNLDNNFDGNFQYDFETENGIVANAVGTVRQYSPKEIGQAIQGSYSYTSPDGRVITTYYTADENGFVAQGDHLPVAPAVPELPPLIAKSVAYILSQPPLPENQQ